jgi:hypothetical protein
MWVTDMTHFLDAEGNVPHELCSRQLIRYLGAIVAAVTTGPAQSSPEVNIKCRKRPGRKSCGGRIRADFEAGTTNIIWQCPICGDGGLIHHWQGTPWDNGGTPVLPAIHRITYRHGLVSDDDLEDLTGLKTVVLEGSSLSREVVVAIHDNELLDASGEYGDPLVGDPLEYDELVIEHAGGTTRIALYNRGIMLLTTNDEFYKRVHRLCGTIEDTGKITGLI